MIAALRRSLASKEEALEKVNRDLTNALRRIPDLDILRGQLETAQTSRSSLEVAAVQQPAKLQDAQAQVRSTRVELVSTIDEKVGKINALEEMILDIRKLRETEADENRLRLNDVRAQLDRATSQLAGVKEEGQGTESLLNERLRKAVDAKRTAESDIDQLQKAHASEMARLRGDLDGLATQYGQTTRTAQDNASKNRVLEAANQSLQADLLQHREKREDLEHQVVSLGTEKEYTARQRDTAISDLDQYQQIALSSESKVVTELRSEIASLRRVMAAELEKAQQELRVKGASSVALQEIVQAETIRAVATREEIKKNEYALRQVTAKSQRISDELDSAKSSLEQETRAVAALERALQMEKCARLVCEDSLEREKRSVAESAQSRSASQAEAGALREAHCVAQEEADTMKQEATAHQSRANHLAREMIELKSKDILAASSSESTISRTRHSVSASVPSIQSSSVIHTLRNQALTPASTGSDTHSPSMKLRTKETEEVERLGKVIEGQKAIIEDQKEKIKIWGRVSYFTDLQA